jgi:hypothetical protein
MTPYIITFVGYYVFHLLSDIIQLPKNIKVIYILSLFFAFVVYTDIKIGADMPDYIELYNTKYTFDKSGPIYGYLANFFNYYKVSFFIFYLCVVSFEFLLLYKISSKLINYNYFLVLYFSNFFLMMQFNAVRQGLSLLILCYALLLNDKKSKYFAYVIAIGVHYSSLMILVIKQFKKTSLSSYFITIGSGLIFGLLIYGPYIDNKFSNFSITFYPALTIKLLMMYIFYRSGINKNLVYAFFGCYVVIMLGLPIISRFTEGIFMVSALLYSKENARNTNMIIVLYILTIILFVAQMKYVYLDCVFPEGIYKYCL